jgi:hypothetical protein
LEEGNMEECNREIEQVIGEKGEQLRDWLKRMLKNCESAMKDLMAQLTRHVWILLSLYLRCHLFLMSLLNKHLNS